MRPTLPLAGANPPGLPHLLQCACAKHMSFCVPKTAPRNAMFFRNAPSVTDSWCSAATYQNMVRFLGPKTGVGMVALAVPSHGTAAVPSAAQVPGPARGRGLSMRSGRKNMNRKQACCVQTGGCLRMVHWTEETSLHHAAGVALRHAHDSIQRWQPSREPATATPFPSKLASQHPGSHAHLHAC